jgi:nucleotide-binding universal stress UspA family protein
MKRVLIPVDGSAKSLEAVRATAREGPHAISGIELVNVQPLFNRHISRWLTRDQREAWRAERSRQALSQARTVVEFHGVPCGTHAAAGAVVDVVAATASRLRCHEIVIGARRRGAIGRLLANSISTRLLEVSAVPVRIIPAARAPFLDSLALPAGLGLALYLLFLD